jgi:hypothetical protein
VRVGSVLSLAILGALALWGCAAPGSGSRTVDTHASSAPTGTLAPSADATANPLIVRLSCEMRSCPVGGSLPVALHVAASDPAQPHTRLLAGQVVFVFDPVRDTPSRSVHRVVRPFSGAGGIDYSGATAWSMELEAPGEPGRYILTATVVSTREDLQRFYVTAGMIVRPGEHWVGRMSTPPIAVRVTDPPDAETDLQRVRQGRASPGMERAPDA